MSCRTERQRLFFALFPSARVCRAIETVQQQLDFAARPVPPEQFHVTLAFLGEQPTARVAELAHLADASHLPSCALRLDVVDAFAGPGVAFLGMSEVPRRLGVFRASLVQRLHEAGFAVDGEPWRPHVTLYRKMRKSCPRMPVEPIDWPLKTYCLVSSRLEKNGPCYRVVRRWNAVG
jgi:2'-5' RNA ligase